MRVSEASGGRAGGLKPLNSADSRGGGSDPDGALHAPCARLALRPTRMKPILASPTSPAAPSALEASAFEKKQELANAAGVGPEALNRQLADREVEVASEAELFS